MTIRNMEFSATPISTPKETFYLLEVEKQEQVFP